MLELGARVYVVAVDTDNLTALRPDSLLMAPLRVWVPQVWAPNQHVVFQSRELTAPPPDLRFKLPAAVLDAYREKFGHRPSDPPPNQDPPQWPDHLGIPLCGARPGKLD